MTASRELPASWRWAQFSEVASVASDLVDPALHPDLPHIAPNHIESQTGRLFPFRTVGEDGVTSNKHQFRSGQVLYSKIRPYLAKVVLAPFEGLCSADMYPLDTTLCPGYLKWWLLTPEFTALAAGQQARTVLPKINKRSLNQLPVPVPPIEEQRRIVDILEDHFSRLDAAVASLTMARRRLVAYERTALDGLTEEAATRHIPLGEALSAVEAGRSFGDAARASFDDEWGIVKVSAMTWGEFRPSENKLVSDQSRVDLRYQIHAGDLLMSRANTSDYVGAPVLVRAEPARLLLSDKSLRLIPREGVSAEYLWRVLSAPRARAQISDRASGNQDSMRNISQATLKAIVIPWTDHQHGVIAAANQLDEQRSRMSDVVDRSHTRSGALRRALLRAAFSGRLTGRSSDLERVEEAVG